MVIMKAKILLSKDSVLSLTLEDYQEVCDKIMAIDKHNMDEELANHAVVYAHYHGLLIHVERIMDRLSLQFDQYKAITKNEEISRNKNNGGKVTVTYLEDYVISQDEYKTKQEEIFELQEIFGWLKAITTSLEHKKDMLIQLSANHRSETKLYN